jgi:hypothetical protein
MDRLEEAVEVIRELFDGEKAAAVSEFADGFIGTAPTESIVDVYEGDGPRYGQVTVCWAESENETRETAHKHWPLTANEGELDSLLPTVNHLTQ